MKKSICALLSLSASVCMAHVPATIADVDAAAAVLQTQVNTLNAIPAVAHPVGSCYGGGVVYYVNPDANAPTGERGLIVSLTDAAGTYEWGPNPTAPEINTSAEYFTGLQNTTTIVEASSTRSFPAANAANAYTSTQTCDTCTPWYLPAQDELATLYFQSTNVTNFGVACGGYTAPAAAGYWSSTQVAPSSAWFVGFDFGFVTTAGLTNAFRVRPVRAF